MNFEHILLILVLCALTLWGNYLLAKEFYRAACEKGYHHKKYLWLPFALGLIGYLLVIALPDHGNIHNATMDDLPDL